MDLERNRKKNSNVENIVRAETGLPLRTHYITIVIASKY